MCTVDDAPLVGAPAAGTAVARRIRSRHRGESSGLSELDFGKSERGEGEGKRAESRAESKVPREKFSSLAYLSPSVTPATQTTSNIILSLMKSPSSLSSPLYHPPLDDEMEYGASHLITDDEKEDALQLLLAFGPAFARESRFWKSFTYSFLLGGIM